MRTIASHVSLASENNVLRREESLATQPAERQSLKYIGQLQRAIASDTFGHDLLRGAFRAAGKKSPPKCLG